MEKEAVHVFITFVVYIRAIVARVLREKEERRSACLSADHVTAMSHVAVMGLDASRDVHSAGHAIWPRLGFLLNVVIITWFNPTLSITHLIF